MITMVVSPGDLKEAEVVVEGASYRHLFRARRLANGDTVRLVDGLGTARFSRAVEISRTAARLELGNSAPANEPQKRVELLAPIPKATRLAWMVEKATEVGVGAIRLIQTARAPRTIGASSLDRLRRVATAAVEQSHRSVVPAITGVHPWTEIQTLLESASERWVMQPGAESVPAPSPSAPSCLLLGPEGGWTKGEWNELLDRECRPLGLGTTVLRLETAAIVGCAGLLISDIFR